jgi:hypothetical protein
MIVYIGPDFLLLGIYFHKPCWLEYFFVYFFLISLLNARLIENRTLKYFLNRFLCDYLNFLTLVWQVNSYHHELFFVFILFYFFNPILHKWLDWELRFIYFLFFFLYDYHNFMTQSWVRPVNLGFFSFFYLISSLNIGWLRSRLYNLFQIAFYEVIVISWPESRICFVDFNDFFISLFLILFFNHPSSLVDCEFSFINYFDLLFI